MIIQTDKEGKDVIEQLCDIALKQGGVSNLNQVNAILKSVKLLPIVPISIPQVKENPQPKSEAKISEKTKTEKKKTSKPKNSTKKKSLKAKK